MKKLLLVIVLLIAVFFVLIAPASAQAQTIYACVDKAFAGLMRWVSGPGQCLKFETQISWNSTSGITQVVHGTVTIPSPLPPPVPPSIFPSISYPTYTFVYSKPGYYWIDFNTPFPGPPDCVVSTMGMGPAPNTPICQPYNNTTTPTQTITIWCTAVDNATFGNYAAQYGLTNPNDLGWEDQDPYSFTFTCVY